MSNVAGVDSNGNNLTTAIYDYSKKEFAVQWLTARIYQKDVIPFYIYIYCRFRFNAMGES